MTTEEPTPEAIEVANAIDSRPYGYRRVAIALDAFGAALLRRPAGNVNDQMRISMLIEELWSAREYSGAEIARLHAVLEAEKAAHKATRDGGNQALADCFDQLKAAEAAHEATKAELVQAREALVQIQDAYSASRMGAYWRDKYRASQAELESLRKPLEGELAEDVMRMRQALMCVPESLWVSGNKEALDRIEAAIRAKGAPPGLNLQTGDDQPWSLRECLAKLCEAADILLRRYDYDGAHWELIQSACCHAKEYLSESAATPEPKGEPLQAVEPPEPQHVCGLSGFGAPGDVCEACVQRSRRSTETSLAAFLDSAVGTAASQTAEPCCRICGEDLDMHVAGKNCDELDAARRSSEPPEPRAIVVGSKWENDGSVFTVLRFEKGEITYAVPEDESWLIPEYTFSEAAFRKNFTWLSDPEPATPAPEPRPKEECSGCNAPTTGDPHKPDCGRERCAGCGEPKRDHGACGKADNFACNEFKPATASELPRNTREWCDVFDDASGPTPSPLATESSK